MLPQLASLTYSPGIAGTRARFGTPKTSVSFQHRSYCYFGLCFCRCVRGLDAEGKSCRSLSLCGHGRKCRKCKAILMLRCLVSRGISGLSVVECLAHAGEPAREVPPYHGVK